MSNNSSFSTPVKIATIMLLLANYALTVNASPLGTADMIVSRFYWVLLLALLLILSVIYYLKTNKSPVEVVGLAYDKTTHKLELTVRNKGDEAYYIKSALRLIQPMEDVVKEATADGRVPMASATASVGNRRMFQLLCEDDTPISIEPNETRMIAYDILLPPEHIKLDASKNVEVHISYSEEAEASKVDVPSQSDGADGFCIRLQSGEVIAEAFLLEDLLEAIMKSPDEAIDFHMKDNNDFSTWVRNVVGDSELANRLDSVKYTTSGETRQNIVKLIDDKVESLKHPYLRKVNSDKKFYLKAGHDKVVSEVLLMEDLAETLANSPADVISFHTREGNDFAVWIKDAVGDTELADRLSKMDVGNPDEAKGKMVSAIRERVDTLKC
jgi:hypothetical protein